MTLFLSDLTCQQAVELVTDYLEGALRRRDRRRLEKHLRNCVNCSAYVDQIRATIRLAGRADAAELDPDTREGLLELYRRYRSDGSGPDGGGRPR